MFIRTRGTVCRKTRFCENNFINHVLVGDFFFGIILVGLLIQSNKKQVPIWRYRILENMSAAKFKTIDMPQKNLNSEKQ